MKKICRLFTLFLAVTMVIGCVTTKAADLDTNEEPIIIDEYKSIGNFTTALSIGSGGRAQCSSLVSTYNVSNSIKLTLSLQRSVDGGTWSSIYTWNASGNGTVSKNASRYVTSGYYYRCVALATVRTSSGTLIESAYIVSYTVRY